MKGSNLSKKCLEWSDNMKHQDNPFGVSDKVTRFNYT
jgi:hypothetical protein